LRSVFIRELSEGGPSRSESYADTVSASLGGKLGPHGQLAELAGREKNIRTVNRAADA